MEILSSKSLTDVFEKISMEHKKKPTIKYTLTASTKVLEIQETKCAAVKNQQDHKELKNMLRVALNKHVLYHSLKKILSLRAGTTRTVVVAQRL